jgi:hypothetical protein
MTKVITETHREHHHLDDIYVFPAITGSVLLLMDYSYVLLTIMFCFISINLVSIYV